MNDSSPTPHPPIRNIETGCHERGGALRLTVRPFVKLTDQLIKLVAIACRPRGEYGPDLTLGLGWLAQVNYYGYVRSGIEHSLSNQIRHVRSVRYGLESTERNLAQRPQAQNPVVDEFDSDGLKMPLVGGFAET